MLSISVVIISFALFMAMVLNLTLKPALSVQLTKGCMLFAIVIGTIFMEALMRS